MPRKASPLSSSSIGNFTWGYIFIHHMICVLLRTSCIIWVFACFILCFKSWFLTVHTYLREPNLCHDLLELLSMLHLNFYEQWTCSSASLISFLARWWFYFIEIIDLSCFTYIILRVLNSMVICFNREINLPYWVH